MLDQIGAKLKQPFTAGDIVTASGVDHKKAQNTITKWLGKEWIERVSTGAYERTEKFGGKTTAAPVEPVRPATPPPVATSPRDQMNPREQTIYHAAMRLPEPFTAESVAVATSLSADAASLAMSGLLNKGFIKVTGKEDGMTLYKIAK